ncbi:Glutaredoxin-like protein grla [Rickettsia africae ESF-5]|uniref:Probable monothiol glutaredoxin 2 n=2 Tax=Rickettsia africae TaxID=35788 RepID=C3PLM1_RICAE|nr:Glutaredoxin-like protein grla [Rickettsia africae ESF-5]
MGLFLLKISKILLTICACIYCYRKCILEDKLLSLKMLENKNFKFIENEIKNNKVVLFMKGIKKSPACGFSGTVVAILNKLGVEFRDINVLFDAELREDLKKFSDWPTFPQLYINGELVGGCDIARELYQSGELEKMLKVYTR